MPYRRSLAIRCSRPRPHARTVGEDEAEYPVQQEQEQQADDEQHDAGEAGVLHEVQTEQAHGGQTEHGVRAEAGIGHR